jgi:hypothetical protein
VWQKACRYNNDSREVKCQKQAFSFNKSEAKVYCYAFLHVLKRDTFIKHAKTKNYNNVEFGVVWSLNQEIKPVALFG